MNDAPLFLNANAVAEALPWPALIDALQQAFAASDAHVPERLHCSLGTAADAPVLLVMPALSPSLGVGTKVISVVPGNAARGLPSIQGLYLLMDAVTGTPLAVIDGAELTARRTAAASALASRHLSRPDSRCLAMVGTGRLAQLLPLAHACTRPIDRVMVWGRSPDKARATAAALQAQGLNAEAAPSLDAALAQADIVSCATLSRAPLLRGDALRPGTHVDLVGAFTPHMCEADERVFAHAAAVWGDTRAGVLHGAGDLLQAIAAGAFAPERLAGDLADLCRAAVPPARGEGDITVFKSVGTALEDLVAARLCVDQQRAR